MVAGYVRIVLLLQWTRYSSIRTTAVQVRQTERRRTVTSWAGEEALTGTIQQ